MSAGVHLLIVETPRQGVSTIKLGDITVLTHGSAPTRE